MAEPLRPAATKTYGKENWIFVPTIASATLAPTAAEVTGASSLDYSRIAFANGTAKPSQTTNRVTAERRLADTQLYEFIGNTAYQGGELTYVFGAQSAAASDPKKMYEKIPDGTTGFLAQRLGVARATTPAAGQFVNVFPVEFGPSLPTTAGDAEAGESAAVATFAITSAPGFNLAILA